MIYMGANAGDISCDSSVGKQHSTYEKTGIGILYESSTPANKMVDKIAGHKWEIDYYHQILLPNQQPAVIDINTPPAMQQYRKIEKFILYLENGLPNDIFPSIEVEAQIVGNIIPNLHDMMIGMLLGGRRAIFTITSINKNNYSFVNLYKVTIKLVYFVDVNTDVLDNLNKKVVDVYSYSKEFLESEGRPVILKSEFLKIKEFKTLESKIWDYYLNRFIDSDTGYLCIPTTDGKKYVDLFITEFIKSTTTIVTHELLRDIGYYSIPSDKRHEHILHALLNRNISSFDYLITNINFVLKPTRLAMPIVNDISYSNIDFITDITQDPTILSPDLIVDLQISMTNMIRPNSLTGEQKYIFTDAFYKRNVTEMGLLEKCVYKYLNKEYIDCDDLITLFNNMRSWTTIEQYYCIPILAFLCNTYFYKLGD